MSKHRTHIPADNLREAYYLQQALEDLIYTPTRSGAAALLAAAQVFSELVLKTACGDPRAVFEDLYAYLCDTSVGLSTDDPAMDGWVFPTHKTVQ